MQTSDGSRQSFVSSPPCSMEVKNKLYKRAMAAAFSLLLLQTNSIPLHAAPDIKLYSVPFDYPNAEGEPRNPYPPNGQRAVDTLPHRRQLIAEFITCDEQNKAQAAGEDALAVVLAMMYLLASLGRMGDAIVDPQ